MRDARVDEIVTALYRRFKDWSKRGFGPDDVTWCEVRADVVALAAGLREQIRAEAIREAAEVARGEAYGFPPQDLTEHGQGFERACNEIAAAILALINKPAPAEPLPQKGDAP
jgi:hypothetical protein